MMSSRICTGCLLATVVAGATISAYGQSDVLSAPSVLNGPRQVRSDRSDLATQNKDQWISRMLPGGSKASGRSTDRKSHPGTQRAASAAARSRPTNLLPTAIGPGQHSSRSLRRTTPKQHFRIMTSTTARHPAVDYEALAPTAWTAPFALNPSAKTTPQAPARLYSESRPASEADDFDVPLGVEFIAADDEQYESAIAPAGHTTHQSSSANLDGRTYGCTDSGHADSCSCGKTTLLELANPESEFFVKGWVAQGFTWNPDSPRNKFNLPTTFNDRSNEYQLNQIYVSMGMEADESFVDWGFGGKLDLLYGTDYFFTTSLGLETHRDGTPRWNSEDGPRRGGGAALYGLAMPQLYAEIWAPVGNGVRLKLGHFYTTLGYETVTAPDNFFYSHSYTMQYGEPFTHTGMLGSTEVAEGVTVHAGFTRGWDNWEDPDSDLSFLGGVELDLIQDTTTFAYSIHVGDEDVPGGRGDDKRSTYSMVLTHHLNDQTRYILQHDLGYQERGTPLSQRTAKWYGVNQYLITDLTDCLSAGTRFEWFRDHNNARILGIPSEEGANYFNLTLGLNWRPAPNMVIRPELRWDWSNVTPPFGLDGVYDDFSDKNQFTLGTDVILSF